MKIVCKHCLLEKEEKEFQSAGYGYKRQQCIDCKREIRNLRTLEIREWFKDFKRKLYCNRCHNTDYRVLEFHHTVSSEKDNDIARLVANGSSIKKIMLEINKCEVLCANCHKIEHYKE